MSATVGDPPMKQAPPKRDVVRAPAVAKSAEASRPPRAPLPNDAARRRLVRSQLGDLRGNEFRPDVEGMRALAVVAVVLFHLRLGSFGGGFVGVDVFFVLSGFLITRLLLRELATNGAVSLPKFWARRARRLLPASFLVLVVTVVASRWMMPPLAQRDLATDATAAGGFVVNFVFANRLGDYFGAQLAEVQPSPLLHFWSLAVEEQFYLLWPLILVAATRRPRQYRRLVIAIILVVAAASVVASVWLTDHRPTWAFYLLPARMGELLAGAALAAAGPAFGAVNAGFRALLGWFGIFGIGVAVVTYDSGTVFPGTSMLLPVLCTVLVIVAGGVDSDARGPSVVLQHPVAQWIGKHSYAIYLWHWPALVLFEAEFGPLSLAARVVVVALAVGLAAISLRLVEDPVRHSSWLAMRPGRGLTLGAALCASALAIGWVAQANAPRLDSGQNAAAPTLVSAAPAPTAAPVTTAWPGGATATSGAPNPVPVSLAPLATGDLATLVAANRTVLEQGLTAADVPANLRPSLGAVGGDRAEVYADGCVAIGVDTQLKPCHYGDEGSNVTIVLYGDSHAAQWSPPLIAMAEERGYELIVLTKGGCPVAAVSIPTATLARTCPIWRDRAIEYIAAARPDLVIVSAWADYPNSDDEWATGFDATMSRLVPLAGDLVVLGDNPPARTEPASCLSGHLRSANACVSDRDAVVLTERISLEEEVASQMGARFIDTTDWLCTDSACPVIIGDILLYRDVTHITTVAAMWFRPLVEASLEPELR